MGIGACMGRATDGDAPVIDIHLAGGTTAEKGQSLKRLERRGHETFQAGISSRHQHPTTSIADHRMDTMDRLRDRSPPKTNLKGR